MTSRRDFVLRLVPATAIGVSALAAAAPKTAAAAPKPAAGPAHISETDAIAVQMGYKNDATKVDKKKYPQWAAGRVCSGCALFQGKPTDAWAACPALGNKAVNAKGWCLAWAKKA